MAQSRLQQLIDHLFSTSSSALVLESNTTGMWLQPGGASLPAFRQPLRTGQILLLLSDVVPKDQSAQLLSGTPTRFTLNHPQGDVAIHITLTGDDVRAEIIPVAAVRPSSITQTIEVPTALMVLLNAMTSRHATHLHVMPGAPLFARIGGQLQAQPDFSPWASSAIHDAVVSLVPSTQREGMKNQPRIEVTHLTADSVFYLEAKQGPEGYSLTARCYPRTVPSLRALRVPGEISSMRGPGVWVIAGAAKQGTSTTLASMLQDALMGPPLSVLMVESPAQYVLNPGHGFVETVAAHGWCELATHARTADFDVVALGSLDDPDAVKLAVALADQGRMVIGTLHADSSVAALEKLASVGEGARITSVTRGVFAQRLISTIDGDRSLIWEFLPCHETVRSHVRAREFSALPALRSHHFDDSLVDLIRSGTIELADALELAEDQQQLKARASLQSVA